MKVIRCFGIIIHYELANDGILQVNERVLFKGVYSQTDTGAIYTCTEIIRLGK